MKATHSLHNRSTGKLVYLLHDTGCGEVFVKRKESDAWLKSWYPEASAGARVFDVRKVNTFKGNK